MMRNAVMQEHLSIAELIPDFVLGKLDETSLRRVARHLETCRICRDECDHAMAALGLLAAAPPPPACLRGAILRRAAAAEASPSPRRAAPEDGAQSQHVPSNRLLRLVSEDEPRIVAPFGSPPRHRTFVAASLAVMLLAGATGLVSLQQMNRTPASASPEQRIESLVNDPAAAFPLDDSDLPTDATGVVFAEPSGRDVYLVANGLPLLPHDQRYQVWLFTTDDQLVSAGLINTDAGGDVRALLETPDPFVDYVGVALTAEPQTGSDEPTSDLVLGGSFPPLSAEAPNAAADSA